MKKIILLLTLTLSLSLVSACGSKTESTPTPEPEQTQSAESSADLAALTQNKRHITIELESGEKMSAEIYPDLAPITVENFIKLINEKYYDGLIFHRVIPGFMIQGGGFDASLEQKTDAEPIKGEFDDNGVKNPLKHTRGVLSMARTNEPDSATSQFFIMHEDNSSLDGQYAAFGKVTEGLEVVDEIANTKTTTVQSKSMQDVPVKAIKIKTITLDD